MVTVKSVEPGIIHLASITLLDAYQTFYANPTFLNYVHRPEILSLHFFKLVKFFLPLTKSVLLVTPVIKFQSFCPTVSLSNENLDEPSILLIVTTEQLFNFFIANQR